MVKVTFGQNIAAYETDFADKDSTLKSFLDEHHIDTAYGQMTLDGTALPAGGLNKTFAEYGYSDEEGRNSCWLISTPKTPNA